MQHGLKPAGAEGQPAPCAAHSSCDARYDSRRAGTENPHAHRAAPRATTAVLLTIGDVVGVRRPHGRRRVAGVP
eukprot:4608118-Prymnesium_polylepis.1